MNPDDPPDARTRSLIVDALMPIVEQARERSRALALEFYRTERATHAPDAEPLQPVAAPHYERDALAEEITRAMRRFDNPSTAATAMTVRHVEQAGRETVTTQARADPAAERWARYATGRETCAFCLMLVSRGAVYESADFAAHDSCDCLAVPVFDMDAWSGRDAYLSALRQWRDATEGYGGTDALNAYRRALYAERHQGAERETATA